MIVVWACAPAETTVAPTTLPEAANPPAATEAPTATAAPAPTEAPAVAPPPTEAPPPATAVPAAESPKLSGKLLIWVQKINMEAWQNTVLPKFQEMYPDVEIEFGNSAPEDIADNVGLAIQGGAGLPDLFVTGTEYGTKIVDLGGLKDLTELVQPYVDQLNLAMLAACSKDGKIYCVPWDIGPVGTFYRRDVFEAAGLKSDPESVSAMIAMYDDLLATCKTIKEKTGLNCFSLNKANNEGYLYNQMLSQQGLGFFDEQNELTIDCPQNVATLEKLKMFWDAGLALDRRRFMSDTYCAYQKIQSDIIRQHCPDHFITHNLMGFGYNQIDYYDLAADLDHVSWDIYPRHQWEMAAGVDPAKAALSCDAMRGLKKQNYWVMEQQSGGGGWEMLAVTPKPGELRLWTYQCIAHGAAAILYFRWRTARFGTEQYWLGILDHHGIPGRRYEEVAQIGQELSKLSALIAGSRIKPHVAIMQSYDARFAFQVQPNHPRFGYESHVQDIYRGLHSHNVPVDVVSEDDALAGYKAVIVPAMYVLTERTAGNLERFAAEGGIVVFTPRTGVKDESNAVVNLKLLGLVARMSGIEVEEVVSMPVDQDNEVQFALPGLEDRFATFALADVIEPQGAEVIARHTQDFYAGKPAATLHRFGKGQVVYLGVLGDRAFYDAIARWIAALAGVAPLLATPAGVEVAERWQGDRRIVFVLNHHAQRRTIVLDTDHRNLLDGQTLRGEVQMDPFGVLILSPKAMRS